MPRRPVLTATEREQLLAFPGDRQQRLQHYTLSDSDLAVIGERDLLTLFIPFRELATTAARSGRAARGRANQQRMNSATTPTSGSPSRLLPRTRRCAGWRVDVWSRSMGPAWTCLTRLRSFQADNAGLRAVNRSTRSPKEYLSPIASSLTCLRTGSKAPRSMRRCGERSAR